MKASRFRFIAILLIASLLAMMITPSSSVPESDAGGPPIILYQELTWHHDCSNTTDFELNSTWNANWYYGGWDFFEAPLLSDGERILLFDRIPAESDQSWFGPTYMLKLPINFSLTTFLSLTVDIEISNQDGESDQCISYVHLVDSLFNPVLSLVWFDDFPYSNAMRYGVRYWPHPGTGYGLTTNPILNATGRYKSTITNHGDEGLNFSIPTFTDHELYHPSEEELLRNITYIAIMYGDHHYGASVHTYLHDIILEFNYPLQRIVQGINTEPTSSLDPNDTLRTINLSTVLVWGICSISASVIIVFSSRIIKHPGEND